MLKILLMLLLFPFFSPNSDAILQQPKENDVFRNIEIAGSKGEYEVTGEVKGNKKAFYFTVEDGHVQYAKETKVALSSKDWEKFTINIHIQKEKLPRHGTLIMILYERDGKNEIVNTNPLVLEKFH